MIEQDGFAIDYAESGSGPTVVLVPGSYSSTAAWAPVRSRLEDRYRLVATSLMGTGGTSERRTAPDPTMALPCAALDAVVARTGGPVHLVGHSWGATVAMRYALASIRPIRSLTLIEPNPAMILRGTEDEGHFAEVAEIGRAFSEAQRAGERDAARRVIDGFAGPGSYAALPPRVRAYVEATAPANLRDWQDFFALDWRAEDLAVLPAPCLLIHGTRSHPVFGVVARRLAAALPGARLAVVDGASHFVPTTHSDTVAALIAAQVDAAEAGS